MDSGLIEGVRRVSQNPRVASGLGVVPRVVAGGRPIYRGKISLAEAHHRIAGYWRPYHDALQTLIDESHRTFGQAILMDCHSMPHEALDNVTLPAASALISFWATGLVRRPRVLLSSISKPPLVPRADGCAQHAVCGGLYRPALWSPVAQAARGADRDRPRALYGRGDAGTKCQL